MVTPLAIDSMTIEEKLAAMEALWQDLSAHHGALPVYGWQERLLDEREQLIASGQATFMDWEQAKKDISRETS